MSGTFQLLEFVQHSGALQVDADKAVIRGVRILGLESANGRTYSREAVRRACVLYEGKVVNVDHPIRPADGTSLSRRFGWLEAVRQDDDGGLRGDLHYLAAHPLAAAVAEAARRRPQLMGLSHNAVGRGRRENGREVIESIESVQSVDLVADPASVSGLFESKGCPAVAKKKLSELIESLKATRPGASRALKEMAEAGLMSPSAEMEEPPAPAGGEEGKDHEEALKSGFRAAVLAILDDDALDLKAKLKKVRDVLRAEEKLLGGNDDAGGDKGGDMGGEKAEEGRKQTPAKSGEQLLREEYERKLKARDLCADQGITPNKTLRKALDACASEAEMKELIEEYKGSSGGSAGGQKPRSAAPQPAPQAGKNGSTPIQEGAAPTDPKAFASWVKG
jgi:hypothetical protein